MLNKQKSAGLTRFRLLLLAPLTLVLLLTSSLAFSKQYTIVDLFPEKTTGNYVAQDTTRLPPPVVTKIKFAAPKAKNKATAPKANQPKFPEPKIEVIKFPAPKAKQVKFPKPKAKKATAPPKAIETPANDKAATVSSDETVMVDIYPAGTTQIDKSKILYRGTTKRSYFEGPKEAVIRQIPVSAVKPQVMLQTPISSEDYKQLKK